MSQSPDKPENVGPKRPEKNIKNTLISYWGIWVILAVIFIFFAIKIVGYTPHPEEEREVVKTTVTPVFGERKYVGSKRCKDCHWKEYETWKNTLHSKFTQFPDEYTIIGDFKRNNKLTVKVTNKAPKFASKEVTTTMYKKSGKLYVNTIGPDWEAHDYEVAYVLGINRKQNYITIFPNGEMYVLPLEWDANNKTWVDLNGLKGSYPGKGNYWSDTESIWQLKCGGCHVTGLKVNYDKDRDSFDSTWVDLGIGCEACHGPGSNHIKAASEYFDYEKDTIINPSTLPWRLRAMVCGQCHNWGVSTADIHPYKKGFPKQYSYPYGYLPGKALYLFYLEKPGEEKKHHQQYNEWRESEHAKTGIMCTNCHNVHQKEENIKTGMTKMTSDSLCMDCHKTLQRRGVHRIHTFGSCVSCHMPRAKGHEHNHTFRFISPVESIKAGGIDKLPNSCNSCHHHKDTPPENLVEFLNAVKMADMPKPYTVHGK